ncbi:MAG: hypothetical protein UU36_C0035G0007 [Candidatus Uhrbacteria bacterium GW2011_GWE2_41_1153]|nr:MAG: hypothetical protein UU36_C0035G0007 [Candidatus Uhrbacteria bacterium GW2011_GWE2_41_1153]
MIMEKHPLHIKNPELQTSPEVQRAVNRKKQRTDESVPNDPAERIEAYMDRLENIFLNPNKRVRERNLKMFRGKIYDALIIKRENFSESYFELQKRIARERGQAVEEIPEDVREQMKDVAIEDQKASLDAWIDYLASEDAVYPAWFKYFVWRNVTKLSQFDKERGEFKKRTDSTVAPYPDIYREPLAQIADIYEKVKIDNKNLKESEIREAFSKKFPNLYAELIQKSLTASLESREEIQGKWIKYSQGSNEDSEKLFKSLEGKGTGWCTAGRSTAETQIKRGDFYVYYTNDASGNPVQPRLAIRMDGDSKIGEVRGILPHQSVEPVMQDVLDKKLGEFGSEADAYRKKSEDMRILTALEKKRENDELFTKDDLIFLYEINGTIEGFGYNKDPRIAELREGRDIEKDMLVIFECTREQIANVPSQINENTKAYIGQLEPGIFKKLPENIEHIYTSFPEKRIRRESVEVGSKSAEQLINEMEQAHMNITEEARYMLKNPDFVSGKNPEEITIVQLTVADLGFTRSATTTQVFERAQALGLELCPPNIGPNYRLKYRNQPLHERFLIGMKQIDDSDGNPHIFFLGRHGVGLWLYGIWAQPHGEWNNSDEFAFCLRKSES